MKAAFLALLVNPVAYVLAFAIGGVSSVVSGIGMMFGQGAAFVCLGCFLLLAAGYITKGMKPNV